MMKKIAGILMLICVFQVSAQSNTDLVKHYEAYYAQMKKQADVQGVISALTHLNVLSPNQARLDTLAGIYMNGGQHLQALNTIGFEKNASDSDMAVEIKAICLRNLNEPQRALEHFEELFKRKPNPMLAYELADLKVQLNDLTGARVNITYGKANVNDQMGRTFYDTQQPYQVPLKAAFIYLEGLAKFKENNDLNIDIALAAMDEALKLAPNFNIALLSKQALEAKKKPPKKED